MALPLVANTCKVVIRNMVDRQLMINDLYFRNEVEGITPLGLADLVTSIASWWTLNVLPLLSEDVVFGVVSARDLSVGIGAEYELSQGPALGGVASEAAPNNVCIAVSFRTGVAGRSFRGRNYISGIPNSTININVLSGTFGVDITDAYNLLLVGGGALPANWVWVVTSYFTGGAPRAVGLTTPIMQAILTDTVVDSQRRRLPGRGK